MQNRGAFLFLYHPRIPAIDPVFLMYGNTKMYERKMRAFQFTWRHFFIAIHPEIRRSECRAAIAVLCMYGVYDTEILLAPSSINFNPQPTLSGASPNAVRSITLRCQELTLRWQEFPHAFNLVRLIIVSDALVVDQITCHHHWSHYSLNFVKSCLSYLVSHISIK